MTYFQNTFFTFCMCLPLFLIGQIDRKEVEKELEGVTLEDVKQAFISSKQEITTTLQKFENLKSLRFSGGPILEVEDERTIPNFSIHIKDTISKGFLKGVNDYSFEQSRTQNTSFINHYTYIDYSHKRSFASIYQDLYRDTDPELTYDKVYFYDGTSTNWNADEDGNLKTNKKIDSISGTATFLYPTIADVITIDANNTHDLIQARVLEGDQVELYIDHALKENLIYVEALNKNGEALWQKSSYTSTVNPPNKNYLKALLSYLDTIITGITNNTITTKAQLIDTIISTLPNENDYEAPEEINKTLLYNTYQGSVARIKLYFGKKENTDTISFTMPNNKAYHKNISIERIRTNDDYFYGLMNTEGKWIIQPKYGYLDHVLDNYYRVRDSYEDDYKLCYLNPKTKLLEPLSFYLAFTDIYNEDYATITKESYTNAIKGLINYKTNSVILEPKYRYLDANKTFYWVQETYESPYEVYRFSDHKKIFEGSFEDIDFYDDYFVTEKKQKTQLEKGSYYRAYDFYNSSGKKLNAMTIIDINPYHSFGKDALLPIIDSNGDISYIQKNGQKAPIDVSKYQKIEMFSYGLAPVKSKENNLWGYINTQGELAIPFMYRRANIFQGGTALVTSKNGKAALINQNNKVTFIFPGYINGYSHVPDRDYGRYTIIKNGNSVTYDHEGKIVTDEK